MLSYILIVVGLVGILAYFIRKKEPVQTAVLITEEPVQSIRKKSVSYGPLNILYASQTGTAAKLSEQFAKEAQQQGFIPEVIDLKDFQQKHFDGRNICVFFLSNTGEGDMPDNGIPFLKALKGKSEIEYVFSKLRYTIFGLGNTQYQFFNKIAKDVNTLLQEKHKARLIYKMGLGDNNASLEDDYTEWKDALWTQLKNRSQETMIEEPVEVIMREEKQEKPSNNLATWKFVKTTESEKETFGQEYQGSHDLEFLTKNYYLKSQSAKVTGMREVRQNNKDGSSMLIAILPENDRKYQTAWNLAVYPENDPQLIDQVVKHFNLNLDQVFDVEFQKKAKLPFCSPVSVRTLLTRCIDLQKAVSKSLLRNLGKLPSRDPKYFQENSAVKTTKQFSRLTSTMHYLMKFIHHYQIEMTFETFVSLSDPIAPRLFTIASSPAASQAIQIVDSLQEQGLCSKFFIKQPKQLRIQIKQSSFDNAILNEKIILVSAGTGFAPFRGYLQDKQILMREGKTVPIISLYFGCRHEDGDFIFREQIRKWTEMGVINKLNLAFSRNGEKKVYVQDLLRQNSEEIVQLLASDKTKLYCCGSLPMGSSITELVVQTIERTEGLPTDKAKEKYIGLEKAGKIIKQLW